MCGITGIYHYGSGAPADSHALERMTSSLAHRGPDDSGSYVNGPLGLGHRRLSILDLSSAGRQPMVDDSGTTWITYNGECYNYRTHLQALQAKGYRFPSTSDTNVILNLYREHGIGFLQRISGMFAMGIWDEQTKKLILARDRLGIKPLYYYDDGQTLLFASELKTLLYHPDFPRRVDYRVFGDYFRLMSIPDPRTIFHNTYTVPPGHYLVVSEAGVRLEKYWDVDNFTETQVSTLEGAAQEFSERFGQCVASHLVSDVPVGAFLSGGVDSSGVVAHAVEHYPDRLQTFSIAFADQPEHDESAYARQVAKHCGTEHRTFTHSPNFIESLDQMIWHTDEPFSISSSFPLFLLGREASRHTKVVLTGDGADEVFGGYPWRHGPERGLPGWTQEMARKILGPMPGANEALHPPSHGLQRIKRAVDPASNYAARFTNFHLNELGGLLSNGTLEQAMLSEQDDPIARHFTAPAKASGLKRKLYAEMKTTLVSEMLTKVDRMTMAFGLEARVPFLDHSMVEWAFTLPDRFKTLAGNGKRVVKKAFETRLPGDILYRPKHGFNVPLDAWFRSELRDWVRDTLSPVRLRERGVFNPDGVADLLTTHEQSTRDNSNRILAVLCLELWFKKYMDTTFASAGD